MASQVQQAASRIEFAALGRAAQREDWVRDIRLRLGMIFYCSSRADAIKILGERFRYRAAYARPALEKILSSVENRPDGFLVELKKVREIIDQSCSNEGGFVADVFYSQLEAEADDLMAQQEALVEQWERYAAALQEDDNAVPNALKMLKGLCRETGSDRLLQAKELRNLFVSLLNSKREVPPIVNLCHGWVLLQTGEGLEEALSSLSAGTQSLEPNVASHLCCRMLSEQYEQEAQIARAVEWSRRSLEHSYTSEASVEISLLMSQLHEQTNAKSHLEDALTRRPSSLINLLADDRCEALANDLLDVVVRVQMRLRREGRQFITQWAGSAREIAEVQRTFGADLLISHELLEAHKTVEERLSQADLISAGHLMRYCESSNDELREMARQGLNKEFDKRREALTTARQSIDSVGGLREARIEAAKRDNESEIANARTQVASATQRSKGAEKQSFVWFGSGCGLFGLFVVTKIVLGVTGAAIEVSPGLGLVMLILAGAPILMAICMQTHHAFKRAALEVEIREKISVANKRLSQAEREADDFHRDHLTLGRKNLAEAEAQLKKVEQALRSLNMERGGGGIESVSGRLRAA